MVFSKRILKYVHSFIRTCTAGAPAATQPPEKMNKNSIRWRQYTNTKNGTNTNRLQTQPSRYRNYKSKQNMDTHKIQASKQQQEIPRFVMRVGLTGC